MSLFDVGLGLFDLLDEWRCTECGCLSECCFCEDKEEEEEEED